jgi:hypothetical protein
MKAEQRKELETNALADRMGHLMQRMKTQPRRATMYYVIAGCVLVIVAFLIVRYFEVNRTQNSLNWFMVNRGTRVDFDELMRDQADTNAGKAAQFQYSWLLYWVAGEARLGIGNGVEGMMGLDEAAKYYRKLAEECADHPIWEPEAMYALAVIEETHALTNPDSLESAKKLYEELVSKHKDSARGKQAQEWLDNYENKTKRDELRQFYREMQTALNVPDANMQRLQQEFMKKMNAQGKQQTPPK